jgi:23S rRNA pseudouridine2605 synthase
VRLNRYIALCGYASRRGADSLIADGKVKINGITAQTMAPDVDTKNDIVSVEGNELSLPKSKVYVMLNKPAGYICSCSDERGRKTVIDIVKEADARLFPVGRLDYDTEGLLILTNDGDFAYRCTHPKHEIRKTYYAVIEGSPEKSSLDKIRKGIIIDDKTTSEAEINVIESGCGKTSLNVTIHEGRNRQVKKMFESIGHEVIHLKRVSIGDLTLGSLKTGEWRIMNKDDFGLLGVEIVKK